jgi:hypothetical protein
MFWLAENLDVDQVSQLSWQAQKWRLDGVARSLLIWLISLSMSMQKVMTYATARVFSSLLTGFMLRTSSGMDLLQVDVEEKEGRSIVAAVRNSSESMALVTRLHFVCLHSLNNMKAM